MSMQKLIKIYTISGVLFLAVLAVSPMKDYFAEWRKLQKEYNVLLENQPKKIRTPNIEIKQIWTPSLGHIDRCVSCHNESDEAGLQKSPEPFKTHPKIYHRDFQDFGCTICHLGQGLATESKSAHGKVKFWDEAMLDKKYLESSCGICHKTRDVPSAPVLTKGKKIIEKANCRGCHKIGDTASGWIPSLNGVGNKVNRKWLLRWLKNPRDYQPKTMMPNFLLPNDEVSVLADFLMTFNTFEFPLDSLPINPVTASKSDREKLLTLGRTRFNEARCVSCHSVNGKGGTFAPDLGKIAGKTNLRWIYNYIKNPKRLQPGVQMPQYRFSEKESIAVASYIMDQFTDEDVSDDSLAALPTDPAFYEKGEKLFRRYNCSGCHELKKIKKSEEIGPELTFIGSKKNYEIEFGKTNIEHNLSEYLLTKLKMPRIFVAGSKMPNFQFTDDEAVAVTTALLSFRKEQVPGEFMVLPKPISPFRPQRAFGQLTNDLACFACHKIGEWGGDIAPDLSMEASQAQEDWLKNYFKIPYSLRPILTERMPNLFLSDKEIATITDYFGKVLVNDSLDYWSTQIPVRDKDRIAIGKQLYFEKFGCQSCHQINSKGGYVGPALDHLGKRLKPGWIYAWLKNPQKYKPGTLEPNNNLIDDEAKTLTVFLMSLQ
jgi:mono/diheme cytochrome c family protein